MVCFSLQLAEKPSAAKVLDDQEGRAGWSANGQGVHGAVVRELLNDAVGFIAHGVLNFSVLIERGARTTAFINDAS
jgi:hypothetical protein